MTAPSMNEQCALSTMHEDVSNHLLSLCRADAMMDDEVTERYFLGGEGTLLLS